MDTTTLGAAQALAKSIPGTAVSEAAAVLEEAETVAASIPQDYSELSEDVDDLKSDITGMTTATASDEGKALKAKTVEGGKVTEWEFGEAGGAMYTTENINLVDLSKWTTGSSGQSDFIPVENGKSYTANFTFYSNRLFAYTAGKESLGSLDTYNGFSKVESFSVYKSKSVITISSDDVAYIKFQNMGRPAAGSWIVEGDIDMPIEFEDEVLVAKQPELDNTRDLMLQEKPVELGELEDALRQRIKMLGFDNQPLSIADVYGYDAEAFPFKIDDGNLMVGDSSVYTSANTTALLFNHEVNRIKFSFASQIIDNNNYKRNPMVVLQSNQNGHNGRLISFNSTGYKPNGIGYIYQWNQDESTQASDNQYSFVHEYTFVSFEIVRNTDSFDIEMIDTEGTKVTRHFTFAQMGVTDADHLGLLYQKNANYLDDLLLAFDVSLSGQPSVGSSSKESPLNGATYDAWGDSYTAPVGSYAAIIAENAGCTVNNLGVSGDKVSSVLTRFNNRSDACGAYVSVLAGVNDYLHDTTMENFRTSVQSLITAVITKAPSSKFLWITPAQIGSQGEGSLGLTLEDYVDAIVEICGKNSVPVLDLYHNGGWYGNVQAFQQIYMSTDLLHPNNVGQTFLAGKIQKALEML